MPRLENVYTAPLRYMRIYIYYLSKGGLIKLINTELSIPFVPVLEEAPKAECHQLQRGLDHKGGGEEVVAVLQCSLQRLRWRQTRYRG